ncbi:hypothetical protein ACH4M4_29900 [Streptomyces sp. NPDC017254]|uniref:hypothetical protein n=1 Tax=unclassified Streptomyces TaxID=2593676 RepID=UPI0037B8A3C8
MTRSENEVDQIVFRWDSENLTGSTGFGPVAWSGPRDEAENLFRISGPVLRASGEETRPALIRLQRRADVMLIRRLPFRDAVGRTSVLCHALVGSPGLLEPATCLGLHAWNWEGADVDAERVRGPLPVIPEEVLVPATGRGQADLDAGLAYAAEELVGTVAELLRHSDERFTVLDERGDTACPVLWGLHSMFGALTGRWAFATHDTVELPALRFVFVGRWSGAASRNIERRRVDPRERTGDRAEIVAARLVRHHLRGVEEGEGGEYTVGSALHAASSALAARRATLLETAAQALENLDRRAGGPRTGYAAGAGHPSGPGTGHGPARSTGHVSGTGYASGPGGGTASWPPVSEPPRPAGPAPEGARPPLPRQPAAPPETPPAPPRKTPGRLWPWGSGGRTSEDAPPPESGSAAVPPGARGGSPGADEAPEGRSGPAAGEPREGDHRPGPSERPDLWFRQDQPGEDGRHRPTTPDHRSGATAPDVPTPRPEPYESELSAPRSESYGSESSASPSESYESSAPRPDVAPLPTPVAEDRRADPYRRGPADAETRQEIQGAQADPYRRGPADAETRQDLRGAPARRDPVDPEARAEPPEPRNDPSRRAQADTQARPDLQDPSAAPYRNRPEDPPPRPDLSKPESADRSVSPGRDDPSSGPAAPASEGPGGRGAQGAAPNPRPSPGPAADSYPRPVLPAAVPAWTGPGGAGGRPWTRLRGRGREREAETGLVHKLPTIRTVEEALGLVERAGSRELLDALRRPQAYLVLTLLLRETARRLPSWEHPLRRELCEVALGRELWAVAPPGGEAGPSEPPEEQRAANAAELHRWAVRPLLGGGDAPVGTVAELLSRLRTSPAPSARETFWLIVDGERPGLPEAVWSSLLREAYGIPRTAPRPGVPASGVAVHPDDPGNGYTRRFLRRAGILLGGLVVAIILLVAVGEWFG